MTVTLLAHFMVKKTFNWVGHNSFRFNHLDFNWKQISSWHHPRLLPLCQSIF